MASLGKGLSGMSKPGPAHNVDLGKAGSFKIHPGKLHAALNIAPGKKIPAKRLKIKASDSSSVKHMKASAAGLKAMHKG
jgi:hypothetical protein